jgi:hypothetical protein
MNKKLDYKEPEFAGVKAIDDLDKPISQLVKDAINQETPRHFIRNSEREFGLKWAELEKMTIGEINAYIEHLDYLWTK